MSNLIPSLVSVIMPAYNAEKYIAEAIGSVLSQDDVSLELICINDGSTDGTLEIVQSFGDKIIVIDSPVNLGIAGARNAGIQVARGEYIAFMDADDMWRKHKLNRQIKQLTEHPHIDVSFTHVQCFLSPELSDDVKSQRLCPAEPLPGQIPPTVLMKRNSFDRVGLFDSRWRVGEFVDWLARAESLGLSFDMLSDVYLDRRIHDTNTGVRDRMSRIDYVRIVKESLDRKRKKLEI